MGSRYWCFPLPPRKPEILFIPLPSIVDRYSETYGPTDFEYCLLAALLGPNCSSLAIEKVGWAFSGRGYSFTAVPVEQGLNPDPCQTEKQKAPTRGALRNWRRGWDSNPRYGRTVHLISNQALSTTQTPLQIFLSFSSYIGKSISAVAGRSTTLFINLPFELFKLSYCSRRSNPERDTFRNTLSLKSS